MSPLSPAPVPACVLALDTATERLAVGLQTPGGAWWADAEGGAAASAGLLPQVQALLGQAGLALQAVQHIAYGQGPGAFTGLRTACAVAQGLAYGLQRRLLPIDSLLIVAEDARAQAEPAEGGPAAPWSIAVAMDARMDEIYGALYRWQAGAWAVLRAPALYTLPAWQSACLALPVQAVAGSAWAAFGDRLPRPAGASAWLQEHSRAAALLRLAVQAAARGEGIDPAEALPLYLRDKVAQTTAERAALREAAAAPRPGAMNAVLRPWPACRPMTVRDLDAVVAIEQRAYSHPWSRGNFTDTLAAGYLAELWFDASDGEVLGYLVAMAGVDELHLLNITVAPDRQGRGLGRLMMAALRRHALAQGAATLWLEVRAGNERAQALYRSLGYVQVGLRRGYYPGTPRREDAVVMSLVLSPPGPEGGAHAVD